MKEEQVHDDPEGGANADGADPIGHEAKESLQDDEQSNGDENTARTSLSDVRIEFFIEIRDCHLKLDRGDPIFCKYFK